MDVLVVGAGPAGLALASACATAGLDTAVLDPRPERQWRATYGLWRDEVPDLSDNVLAATATRTRAFAEHEHVIDREYAVLDNAALRRHLSHPAVRMITGTLAGSDSGPRGATATLSTGRRIAAGVIANCAGAPRTTRPRAEQSAFGLVLPERATEPLLPPGEALFMDWRPVAGHELPTFLYAVPLGGGHVLLEETSLAHRPGVAAEPLRHKLSARLRAHGVDPVEAVDQERVRFPVQVPLPRRGLAFGAAAAMVHPATGYSVAAALRTAPEVAATLAAELPGGPEAAVRAARAAVWPRAARHTHALRTWGLRAVLSLAPHQVPAFFEVFFRLPPDLQRAYLSERDSPTATAAAMTRMFTAAPWRLRASMVR
ncbi:lycopene cyclase family protein [Herbihabitans rhizosphaerae]|uniref:lycopene cyclase family protein n=1 Tax=Herbihabitans rhizosphaerae TaxID=1872711 RepID=UPI0030FEFB0C